MTPIRARVRRLVDEGNAWLFIALFSALTLAITAQGVIQHYDMQAYSTAIEDLTSALDTNNALVQKSIAQSKANFDAIKNIEAAK